jgi:hypothetical protein
LSTETDNIKARIAEIDDERAKLWKKLTKLICPFKVGDRVKWTDGYVRDHEVTGTVKRIALDSYYDWWAYVRVDGSRGSLYGVGRSREAVKIDAEGGAA